MVVTKTNKTIDKLFNAGAHYGYSRSRRHPSVKSFIFGAKNTVEIFDLEKTQELFEKALAFMQGLGSMKRKALFVSGKNEARHTIHDASEKLSMPFVSGRWIGGTLTNFSEIRKRVDRLVELKSGRDKGTHEKYTKHERLLIDREIEELEERFGGIVSMEKIPAALVIVDPREESTAVSEAQTLNIPIVAIANSDCNVSEIDYVIPANDANTDSIKLIIGELAEAYEEGLKNPKTEAKDEKKKEAVGEKKDNG